MADVVIPLPRISDDRVIAFFQRLQDETGLSPHFRIAGFDDDISLGSDVLGRIQTAAKHSIQSARIHKSDPSQYQRSFSLDFSRNGTGLHPAVPDQIRIINNNCETADNILAINEAISEVFSIGALQGAALKTDPEAFAKVITSHQDIIGKLERNLADISTRFAEERIKLQTEQADFLRDKQAEYTEQVQKLEEGYRQKQDALTERQKQLDDRDNMHARRAIRADIKSRLLQYANDFTLTEKTRRLRWPIHAAVWTTLAIMCALIVYLYYGGIPGARDGSALYIFSVKSALLTIAALGILTWYIRWMNRWFDRHADAELNLKQFELDVDRASWVVETAMEWRASQNGVMPTILLESISRNLFARSEKSCDHEMNPADYIASAVLGSASRAKISIAGNEIELDRRGLKEIQKSKS